MSTYSASGIKAGDTLNLGTLISEMEKLPTDVTAATNDIITSVASTTHTALVGVTLSLTSDDVVLIVAHANFSILDASIATLGSLLLYRDTTPIGYAQIVEQVASSNTGQRDSRFLLMYDQNQSGSVSYSLKFARFSGSGTIYSLNASLFTFACKKKA